VNLHVIPGVTLQFTGVTTKDHQTRH